MQPKLFTWVSLLVVLALFSAPAQNPPGPEDPAGDEDQTKLYLPLIMIPGAAVSGAFGKTTPINGAIDQPATLTLDWSDSSGATSYSYCYDTTDDDTCSNWTSAGAATQAVISGLSPATAYFWQVRASNSGGDTHANGGADAFWGFTTTAAPPVNQAPNTPGSPAPADATLSQAITVTLQWTGGDPDGDAVTYDVYFEASNDTPDVLVSDNQTAITYTPGALENATTYFWQIVATDEHGLSTTGPVWSFTVAAVQGAFFKTSPVDGAADLYTILTLDWGDSSGATSYSYCYDTTDDDTCSNWISAGAATQATTSRLIPSTTYYWQVRAFNSFGNTDANKGAFWSFTTWPVTVTEMIPIPAGYFQMGCDPDHNAGLTCQADALPLHAVYLDTYLIDKTEVTNAQYAACEAAGVCRPADDADSDNPGKADYPVLMGDVAKYCAWAGKRLPTEAEWEKAARGTSVRTFPWGDTPPNCTLANYNDCHYATTRVGSYPAGASPYGVLDMAGNVAEWVGWNLFRGGSWYEGVPPMVTSARFTFPPDYDDPFLFSLGFRCAASPVGPVENQPPFIPGDPVPSNAAVGQPLASILQWIGGDPEGDTVTYDVYLEAGDDTPDILVSDNQAALNYAPVMLENNTTYFWQIVATDEHGRSRDGFVWSFATRPETQTILIPAGEFSMGCDPDHNSGEPCDINALPLHTVYLDAFRISVSEVTNSQYAQCVAAGYCTAPSNISSSTRTSYYDNPAYADYPIIYTSWHNAAAYCAWVEMRLPTEAEWEKAARGTGISAFPWGDASPTCDLANYGNCVGDTTPVGSYPAGASPYGVLDLAGNVAEWVQDWYQPDYYTISPLNNPPGPAAGTDKVIRGGDWYSGYPLMIPSFRSLLTRPDAVGFRCAGPAEGFFVNQPPSKPGSPIPTHMAVVDPLGMTLKWTGGDPDGDVVTYDVYLETGDSSPDVLVSDNQLALSYTPETLAYNTTYYWQIVATDEHGRLTSSPVWTFSGGREMALVPAGEFLMGCDPDYCDSDVLPLHTIYLDAYRIDQTEVTNGQYAFCVAAGSCKPPSSFEGPGVSPTYYGNPEDVNYPVVYVSWYDAANFCAWSGKYLPTEAEWEKAARGTSGRIYPWGDTYPNCSLANHKGWCMDGLTPVGNYPSGASPYGVLDLAGNAWEWVQDWFQSDYYLVSPPGNPQGPATGTDKGLRGGSWRTSPASLATWARNFKNPNTPDENTGFRCAAPSTGLFENQPPSIPGAPVPANAAVVDPLGLTLHWTGGDPDGDAVTYSVYFEANDSTPDILVSDHQTTLSYYPGTLNYNTFYTWQIIVTDEHGFRSTGPVWSFTVGAAQVIFTKTSPADGAADQPTTLTLDWMDSNGATSYSYCYDNANDDTCSNWNSAGAATQATTSWLVPSTTYYWQVRAFYSLGYTDANAGAFWSFTTLPVTITEMITIPAGEFPMGCDPEHVAGYMCEGIDEPLHTVYLDTYRIDRTEVTNAQYAACVTAGACTQPLSLGSSDYRPSYYDNPTYANYPVVWVSWFDAEDYCTWAGKRLPTEAEWEKAARGTSVRTFPWGDSPANCTLANYNDCPVYESTQVGSYPAGASPYDVLDMAGNVFEWVQDWYQSDYYTISPGSNPPGPAAGTDKVLRGGAWETNFPPMITSYRHASNPNTRYWVYGFRCAAPMK